MLIMEENLRKVLRAGLMTNNSKQRQKYLESLRDHPQSSHRNYVEAALKDHATTLDDQDKIESGEHFKHWKNNNLKEQYIIQESDTPPSSFNEYLTDIEKHSSGGTPIRIRTNKYDGLELEVGIEELVDYLKRGEYFLDNSSIDDGYTNNKIMNVLKAFNNNLSKEDQDVFKKSLNSALDEEKQQDTHKYSNLKTFVQAFNKKLSKDERKKFLALLQKQSKDIFNTYDR